MGDARAPYDRAGAAYNWDEERAAGIQLITFAKELKQDAQLESLLRERGREFGHRRGFAA
jgi:hypothetical protein